MKTDNRKGLTLVELIMVMAMMTILTATVCFVYNLHFKTWNEVYTRSLIRGHLSQALELMSDRLLQATSITAFTQNSITFTADLGGGSNTYRLYLYNGSLLSAEGTITDGSGVVLAANILQPSNPSFTMNGKVITINLTVQKGDQQVTMMTSVRPRNL